MVIEKIVLVEMDPKLPCSGNQLLLPRHGALTIGSKLKEQGHDVTFLYEPITGEITADIIKDHAPDLVAFTGISASMSRIEPVARELSKEGIEILIGGEHASLMPELTDFADYTIVNEGEEASVKLLHILNNGRDFSKIPNLRYKSNGSYTQNTITNPTQLPVDFRYDLSIIEGLDSIGFLKKQTLRLPLQTSRGCPYECEFCTTKELLGEKYRRRPVEDIVADIESGLEKGINSFMIVDNHFGLGEKETTKLLETIIAGDYGARFAALVRADLGKHEKVVELMRKAGIRNVSVGIESISEDTLNEFNKQQNMPQIIDSLKVFHNNGISVLGLFVVGADNDTVDTVRQIPEFAMQYNIEKLQISPLTFFPQQNKQHMIPHYRLISGIPLDYYNGHFVAIFPKQIRPSVLQKEIGNAYREFYSAANTIETLGYSGRRIRAFFGKAIAGYVEKQIVTNSAEMKNHTEMLREIERPFYEGNLLNEDKLRESIP